MDLSFVPVSLERCRTVYGTAFRNYTEDLSVSASRGDM